ncbi:MAG: 3-deoxy-D-manno-octulosonic acid transferase [Mariniblastus sp.]
MTTQKRKGFLLTWVLNAIYVCFLILGSPWLLWRAIFKSKNRRGWGQKLFGWPSQLGTNLSGTNQADSSTAPDPNRAGCIWFHAVSVGEVNLLAPVLNRLKQSQPDVRIAISTTTETGFDLARSKYSAHEVFFCPMDFSWAIKRVIKRLKPRMLVLAELELWPNLIRTTRGAGVPVAVINGRLSKSSFDGYKNLSWLLRPVFQQLSFVAAQNPTYADRFKSLGTNPRNVVVTGSVKFDGIETDRGNAKTIKLQRLAGIEQGDQVFVAGSTQLEEDLIAARTYRTICRTNPRSRLILVPRHPERCSALTVQLRQMGLPTLLRSQLNDEQGFHAASDAIANFSNEVRPILIVDVIGELGAWWGCADAAYVGGSMGKRNGQNMIEPAGYGVPVSFGPKTENFREIVDQLLREDAATVISNQTELTKFVQAVFSGEVESGERAQKVVLSHIGGAQRTVEALCEILDANSSANHDNRAGVTRKKAA